MKIRIITVGRLKEKYLVEAVKEYEKRLSRFCKLELIEVKDEKIPENYSQAESNQAVKKEGLRILGHLPKDGYVATLEINGKIMTSPDFAQKIAQLGLSGTSTITFIIGGSLGLHPDVIEKSNWHLSFSKMTFPHQLFKVMLLEQIYRGFKINHNETYHK